MIKAEFINTEKEFKWRLVYGNASSEWYSYYQGLLTWLAPNGYLYGLASGYWEGTLPIEKPFQIIEVSSARASV